MKKFSFDPAHSKQGSNAKTFTFNLKVRDTGMEEIISVDAYFKRKYNVDLTHWQLPLIQTEPDGVFRVFPTGVCEIVPYQKYQFKLSPEQVRFSHPTPYTPPSLVPPSSPVADPSHDQIRRDQTQGETGVYRSGVSMLNWKADRYLTHFGLEIESEMSIVYLFSFLAWDPSNFFHRYTRSYSGTPRFSSRALASPSFPEPQVDGTYGVKSSTKRTWSLSGPGGSAS
jgi:hypothetical protein